MMVAVGVWMKESVKTRISRRYAAKQNDNDHRAGNPPDHQAALAQSVFGQ